MGRLLGIRRVSVLHGLDACLYGNHDYGGCRLRYDWREEVLNDWCGGLLVSWIDATGNGCGNVARVHSTRDWFYHGSSSESGDQKFTTMKQSTLAFGLFYTLMNVGFAIGAEIADYFRDLYGDSGGASVGH